MQSTYTPKEIEENAQRYWKEKKTFQVVEELNKEKFYCLSMMPYPSGKLHMGHVRNYTIGDVISRYQRMLDKNVLQPMSWDAFGLPAENAAIQHKIPPAIWTKKNIDHMRNQMLALGFAYDWNREIATNDPEYYRWEQWFFLTLFKKGLVYKKKAMVNWDPVDQTILANEQVIDGRGWRSNALVERVEIPQWFLKITAYAEELLNDIDKLIHWPQPVKTMQRHWIGRSQGVEIDFPLDDHSNITVYTTRQDTLYGVTFIALAPEHPIVKEAAKDNPDIAQFIEECKNIKMAEAEIATLDKKGIALNRFAKHPLTHELIPLWVANFVLLEYGAGALMAVPAHDARDFEFAQKYHLRIKAVIAPKDGSTWDYHQQAMTEKGQLVNSGAFTGLSSEEALIAIANHLESQGVGKKKIHYRLRDWSISRQRYWGVPIPIINCDSCGVVPVPEEDLPVILPENVEFEGIKSPLKSLTSFLNTTCPHCGAKAQRETDTFDTFVESSWYYARLACKNQNKTMLDGRANYWLPVDQYIGGIEHAVLHLLYARFFHKLMRDEGLVNSDEPFTRLLNHGMVLNQGIKMSKSKGNVVDPSDLIEKFGADTVRLFIMFAAPPDQALEWSDSGVEGSHRFLKRLWIFAYENQQVIKTQNRLDPKVAFFKTLNWNEVDKNQTAVFKQIYDALADAHAYYEKQQYNTVISSCMKILNALNKLSKSDHPHLDLYDQILHEGMSILLRLLAPITPHISHELWIALDFEGIILDAPWPKIPTIDFKIETIELVIQINGKLRSKIQVQKEDTQTNIEAKTLEDSKVKSFIGDQKIKKIIIVPGKLVNVVTEK